MASFKEIESLVNDPQSIKILVTVSADGIVHAVPKGTIHTDEAGNIEYAELFESSQSYRNITASLWFNKKAAILIIGENGAAYEVSGSIKTILVAGRKFEEAYKKIEAEKGFDIAAVIKIVPESVEDLNPRKKFAEQEETHFFYKHLDRIAKQA
ncbi:MAG TPA: hypothetical protein DD811_10475 [Syntrophomonas sp.]|jgi:hypothetical protein|nr:hypothetical protein [Syntrophomonas sp.]